MQIKSQRKRAQTECSPYISPSLKPAQLSTKKTIGFPGGLEVKNPPTRQETQVQFLGWDNLLEKKMATQSSILAWELPWTEQPHGLHSMGQQRVRHFAFMDNL